MDKFVAETSAKHPIVIESSDSATSFGIKGFPTTYLIGADGKVVAEGMPSPDMIEAALTKVNLPPALPEKLAAIQKLLDAKKFGEARKALEKPAADEKAAESDRTAAAAMIEWLDGNAKRRLESATAEASSDPVSSAEALSLLSEQFKGVPAGDEAAKALKDLLADPARKKEVDAAKKLDDLRERIAEMKPKKAIPAVKGFLTSWKGTKAAGEAQKILDKLVAEDK